MTAAQKAAVSKRMKARIGQRGKRRRVDTPARRTPISRGRMAAVQVEAQWTNPRALGGRRSSTGTSVGSIVRPLEV